MIDRIESFLEINIDCVERHASRDLLRIVGIGFYELCGDRTIATESCLSGIKQLMSRALA